MLNTEEINMLSAFNTFSRKTAVQDILSRLPFMEDEELKTTSSAIIRKLENMSDEEFFSYDFSEMEETDNEQL